MPLSNRENGKRFERRDRGGVAGTDADENPILVEGPAVSAPDDDAPPVVEADDNETDSENE